jgi:hypothetical protein
LQVSDRFHRRSSKRLLAGFVQITHCFLVEASLAAVSSHECWLIGDDLGKLAFQGRGNAAMQQLATAAQ